MVAPPPLPKLSQRCALPPRAGGRDDNANTKNRTLMVPGTWFSLPLLSPTGALPCAGVQRGGNIVSRPYADVHRVEGPSLRLVHRPIGGGESMPPPCAECMEVPKLSFYVVLRCTRGGTIPPPCAHIGAERRDSTPTPVVHITSRWRDGVPAVRAGREARTGQENPLPEPPSVNEEGPGRITLRRQGRLQLYSPPTARKTLTLTHAERAGTGR